MAVCLLGSSLSAPRAGDMHPLRNILLLWCMSDSFLWVFSQNVLKDEGNESALLPRNVPQSRIRHRIMGRRTPLGPILAKKEVCYEMIGCFDLPRKHSFKKPPQSPEALDTKFWLYTRSRSKTLDLKYDELLVMRKDAQLLRYGDHLDSIKKSTFDPKKPSKVLIHGFKGSGKDKGALSGVQEFLKLEDVNVLVVDWEKGAADSYSAAAANTELIGRQTAVMLSDLIYAGTSVKDIHIIGFSLGAHIAGCAGEMLKMKGYKLARITGLDPASPLFKHHLLREPSTKLDATKADFVDIIHTDGSPVFTDGFGLLRPIGHVDFFPNGGREQRGCSDGRGSVVVSHLEGTVNSSVVCSHVRAWQLFLESVINLQNPDGCQFVGFPCQGGNDMFAHGRCFMEPKERCFPGDPTCNIMGMGAYKDGARGALYLATREAAPFCGEQLQVSVEISPKTEKTRGYLNMRLRHGLHVTDFKLSHEFSDSVEGGTSFSATSVAERHTISTGNTPTIEALLSFQSLEFQTASQSGDTVSKPILVDNIYVSDSGGHKWHHCGSHTPLQYINETTFATLEVKLHLDSCQAKQPKLS